MLTIDFVSLMRARGITQPFTYLTTHGFTHHTATNLVTGKNRSFHLGHIERLCEILHCTPNDILRWTPNADSSLSAAHPLTALQGSQVDSGFLDELRTMPLEELKRMAKVMKEARAQE